MNVKKIIFLLVILASLTSCFKDKGNYDYNKIHKIQVTTTESVSLIVGERKGFTATVVTEPDYKGELAFEWLINSKIVATSDRYLFEATEVGEFRGLLRAYDVETGLTYGYNFRIVVKPDYETGFMVLSETEDGNSEIHLIRSAEIANNYYMDKINDTIEYRQEYFNIYNTSMLGSEKLEGKPISLNEHFALNDYETVYGEVTIETQKGNTRNYTELNGLTLKRETYINQEFTNKEVPANFKPKTLVHTAWDTFLLDDNGLIYPRRLDNSGAYHTGRFDKDLTLYGGAIFSDLIYTYYPKSTAIFALELVKGADGATKRNYIGILENKSSSPDLNQMKLPFVSDNEEIMADFVDVKDKIVFSDSYRAFGYVGDDELNGRQIMIMQNSTNEYILHFFETSYVYKQAIKVLTSKKINLTKDYGITKVVDLFAFQNSNNTHAYFATDDEILYFNNKTLEIGSLGKSSSKIVAIAGQGRKSISKSRAENNLAVAYEDGTIDIFVFAYETYDYIDKIVYKSEGNFGKIKDIIYKYGVSSFYFNI